MKKLFKIVFLFACFTSCEEVIDVNLNNAPPRLVIDASIEWLKNTAGNAQEIKLSLSAPYFDELIPPATGAQVFIEDSNNNRFNFIEEASSGIYSTDQFIPVINETYTLSVLYENDLYIATETLKSVVDFDFVEQNNEGGFTGDETELKVYYTDPVNETNFYFFEFFSDLSTIPSLEVYEDKFTNGNQIFGFYSEEDLETGDEVIIKNHGVSSGFYEFMFILLQQNLNTGGGPFETQPTTVRGNCVNISNPENFPFGYFRLSETAELVYIVE